MCMHINSPETSIKCLIFVTQVSDEKQADAYWCKVPSIGEYNVQSYVCNPSDGIHDGIPCPNQTVQGYALSGGGRYIQRVDVSGDDGKTWTTAQLHQPAAEGNNCRVWGWCLWSATVATKRNVRIVSRAGNVFTSLLLGVFYY